MSKKSKKPNLEFLLEKNAYTEKGLDAKEFIQALELIINPDYAEENCCICELFGGNGQDYLPDKAIYDTGLCQDHAIYALYTRK